MNSNKKNEHPSNSDASNSAYSLTLQICMCASGDLNTRSEGLYICNWLDAAHVHPAVQKGEKGVDVPRKWLYICLKVVLVLDWFQHCCVNNRDINMDAGGQKLKWV